jgi:hypothetical protein
MYNVVRLQKHSPVKVYRKNVNSVRTLKLSWLTVNVKGGV